MRIAGLALAAALCPRRGICPGCAELYKVDFTIHDSADTAAKNGRKYSLLVNPAEQGDVEGGKSRAGGDRWVRRRRSVEYAVHVYRRRSEYRLHRGRTQREILAMHADLDMSTAIPPEKTGSANPNPTISQIKINYGYDARAGQADGGGVLRRPRDVAQVRCGRDDDEDVKTPPAFDRVPSVPHKMESNRRRLPFQGYRINHLQTGF